MTVTIEIPKDIESRLAADAEASGVPLAQLVQDFLRDHYDEIEDLRIAEFRLDHPESPISGAELRKRLDLGD